MLKVGGGGGSLELTCLRNRSVFFKATEVDCLLTTHKRTLQLRGLLGCSGGAGGIRTLDTGLPYTHFPGVRLRPLGHCSALQTMGSADRREKPLSQAAIQWHRKIMKKILMIPAAVLAFSMSLSAKDQKQVSPSPDQIINESPKGDWVRIPSEDLLIMTIGLPKEETKRQVVIQLMPPPSVKVGPTTSDFWHGRAGMKVQALIACRIITWFSGVTRITITRNQKDSPSLCHQV